MTAAPSPQYSSDTSGPKFDYCCHDIERKDCEQCSRASSPTPQIAGGVRERELESVLREVRRYIDPDGDPTALTAAAMRKRVDAALSPQAQAGETRETAEAWVWKDGIPAHAQPPAPCGDKGTPAEYWEYVGGLAGEFERDQMREMLAQRGLQIVGISDPAYTGPEYRQALENARQEIVLAIAFLGRDIATKRLDITATQLCTRLANADAEVRRVLALPSTMLRTPSALAARNSSEVVPAQTIDLEPGAGGSELPSTESK